MHYAAVTQGQQPCIPRSTELAFMCLTFTLQTLGLWGGKENTACSTWPRWPVTPPPLPLAAFFLFAPLAALLMTPQSPLSPLLDPPGAFLFGGVPGMTWKLRPAFLLLGKSLRFGIRQKAAGTTLSLLIAWDKPSAGRSQIGSIPLRGHVCSFRRCCLISFLVLLFRTSFHFQFLATGPASPSTSF